MKCPKCGTNNGPNAAWCKRCKYPLNGVNKVPEYFCPPCSDQGGFELYHYSTDAVYGWVPCHEPVHKTDVVWKYFKWKYSASELAAMPPF